MLMNQIIIGIGYIEHHVMRKELMLVLVFDLSNFLLPPNLKHFAVRIGVFSEHKSWASSRSIFRNETSRLVPYTTSIAKCFRTQWSCPPLWCLIRSTMKTLPSFTIATRIVTRNMMDIILFLFRSRGTLHCLLPRARDYHPGL